MTADDYLYTSTCLSAEQEDAEFDAIMQKAIEAEREAEKAPYTPQDARTAWERLLADLRALLAIERRREQEKREQVLTLAEHIRTCPNCYRVFFNGDCPRCTQRYAPLFSVMLEVTA